VKHPYHNAYNAWVSLARSVKIEHIIEQRSIPLRGNGTERCGPCPICGGTDRFAVNIPKQLFNCRGCDVGGDVIKLVEHLDGTDFTHACELLTGERPPKLKNGRPYTPKPRQVVVAEFRYLDQAGELAFVVERREFQNADGSFVQKGGKNQKTFRQRRPNPDHPGQWIWDVKDVAALLYRLPELIAAVANGQSILVVEGESKTDLLACWNIAATCCAMGAGKWREEHAQFLRGADVVLVPDQDDAGWKHANEIGVSLVDIAKSTRVLVLPGLSEKGDVVDWVHAGGTREQLDELLAQAPDWQSPAESAQAADEIADEARAKAEAEAEARAKAEAGERRLLDELARLTKLDYEKRRRAEAKKLGVRSSALDDLVRRRREEGADPVLLFKHWAVEPWPEPVDVRELIAALINRIKQHVVLSDEQALTVALWILFAWAHAHMTHSPMLVITSAEANSGKTQLGGLVAFATPNALLSVGVSEAALFRTIDKWLPTVITDEADTILADNEPLRAVINSGWTRGAYVVRCIGDSYEPATFSTFCPKVVVMKGLRLPDTTLSRSIVIVMKRKRPGENVTHFRSLDDPRLLELRRRALRWAEDAGEKLAGVEPDLPPGFDNRRGDNWIPLLAIADSAGDEWPARARKAAVELSKVDDTASVGVQLLTDTRTAFGDRPRMGSAELTDALGAIADSRWAEWKHGKPLTQRQLSWLLRPFGIAPQSIWAGTRTLRGYERSQFTDAWERYLPPE
jgi:hypothetical protein